MFANELLKNKLSFQLESQENQAHEVQDTDLNNEVDFTFDNYIPKQNDQIEKVTQSPQNLLEDNNISNQEQQFEQTQQDSSELQILKSHILTIQSIAMKEIQGLRKQLDKQMQEKQMLKEELQKFRINSIKQNNQSENDQMLNLLKEQNKMLKTALKKQLQINKNLIKDTFITKNGPTIQPTTLQIKNEFEQNKFQADKENNSLVLNSIQNADYVSKERLRVLNLDRPTIPLPTQNKRTLRV